MSIYGYGKPSLTSDVFCNINVVVYNQEQSEVRQGVLRIFLLVPDDLIKLTLEGKTAEVVNGS